MRRKIIQLAGRTLVVSIPSKWAKARGIKKGDELEITETGKDLLLRTEKDMEQKKAVIDIKKLGAFDGHYLTYLYHSGVDEVEILFDDSSVLAEINNALNHLLGFEIVNQGKSFCTVKNVSSVLESEFDAMLRRTFLSLKEMSESCLDLIIKRDYEGLSNVAVLEQTNNKFTDFCKRVINKKGCDGRKSLYLYCIVRDLEKIADHYKYICNALKKCKNGINKEVIEYFNEVNDHLQAFSSLFYKHDREKFAAFTSACQKLGQKGEAILLHHSGKSGLLGVEMVIISNLLAISTTVSELTGPYYNLAFIE